MNDYKKTCRSTIDEAVISSYDNDEDPIPIQARTIRSVSFARNYLLCNIVIQCLLFACILFFILTEDWYSVKVHLVYEE